MTKYISLDNGKIKKKPACALSKGISEEIVLDNGVEGLVDLIPQLEPNEALMTGICGKRKSRIVSRALQSEYPTAITRTKENWSWPNGDTFALFAFDHDPHPSSPVTIDSPEDFIACMKSVEPRMENVEYVRTYSTSSGIYLKESGEVVAPPSGFHLYMPHYGGNGVEYATWLFRESVIKDLGFVFISRSGQAQIRTVFDKTPLSPEWLLFEAGAEVSEDLVQRLPPPEYREGFPLSTAKVKLTKAQEDRFRKTGIVLKAAAADEINAVRELYIKEETERLVNQSKQPLSRRQAERTVKTRLSGNLKRGDILFFDEHGPVSVGEVIDSPEKYSEATLADPLEPEYGGGRSKAQLYINDDKSIRVNSFAHGGRSFKLLDQESGGVSVQVSGLVDEMYDKINAALASPDVEIYQRGDNLVELGKAEDLKDNKNLKRDPKAPALKEIQSSGKMEILATRKIDFYKLKKEDGMLVEVPCGCPPDLAGKYLQMCGHWDVPHLFTFINIPTMTADGRILHEEGYDAETGVYVRKGGLEISTVGKITEEKIAKAKKIFESPYLEFPYIDEASRSISLSLMLSLVLRPTLDTVPLHAFNATGPGQGKSLLVSVAHKCTVGVNAAVMSLVESDEENEKRIASALIEGDRSVNLDNINGRLGNDTLCMALTERECRLRRLGHSNRVRVMNSAVFTATGNGLMIDGDLVRRSVMCTLDAKNPKPETRKFKQNHLEDYARGLQAEMLWAIFVLLVAFEQRDKMIEPKFPTWLGGFEDWSRRVRNVLIYHGYADPVSTQDSISQVAPERTKRVGIFNSLHVLSGGEIFSASDVHRWGDPSIAENAFDEGTTDGDEDLSEAEKEEKTKAQEARNLARKEAIDVLHEYLGMQMKNSKSIGKYLSGEVDRRVENFWLQCQRSKARGNKYRVLIVKSKKK
ncbi:MAG TPA: hypothetical protein ENJ80_04325 [Gammaproteobacteria bacterium]|nr:hypothetical protein [Gammaproteobacteria bacterium]